MQRSDNGGHVTSTAIASLLDQYDRCALECDGLPRVCHTVLTENNVPHAVMFGRITHRSTGQMIVGHFWIEVEGGTKVDYRARMWLGEPGVPHGVFSDTDQVLYEGNPVEMELLPKYLFDILVAV